MHLHMNAFVWLLPLAQVCSSLRLQPTNRRAVRRIFIEINGTILGFADGDLVHVVSAPGFVGGFSDWSGCRGKITGWDKSSQTYAFVYERATGTTYNYKYDNLAASQGITSSMF